MMSQTASFSSIARQLRSPERSEIIESSSVGLWTARYPKMRSASQREDVPVLESPRPKILSRGAPCKSTSLSTFHLHVLAGNEYHTSILGKAISPEGSCACHTPRPPLRAGHIVHQ